MVLMVGMERMLDSIVVFLVLCLLQGDVRCVAVLLEEEQGADCFCVMAEHVVVDFVFGVKIIIVVVGWGIYAAVQARYVR